MIDSVMQSKFLGRDVRLDRVVVTEGGRYVNRSGSGGDGEGKGMEGGGE